MVDVIRIPKLGLSDYGELVSWEVDIGEPISEGEPIAILESEKASAEIESPAGGVLLETYVSEGEEVEIEVGKPLGVVGEEGETVPTLDEVDGDVDADSGDETAADSTDSDEADGGGGSADAPEDVKVTPRAKRRAEGEDIDFTAIHGTGPQGAITEEDVEDFLERSQSESESKDAEDVKATPRAKRRIRDEDVELAAIEGTGPQGAVTEDDIERYLESIAGDDSPDGEKEPTTAGGGDLTVTESRELSGVRKTIADRLSRSAREKPHVMGTREVSIEQLERVQNRLADAYDVEVSLNDLLLYLVGDVLEDLPEFNAHFEDGTHKLINEVNVGYAVDGPRGLVVPVIGDLDDRSLPDLAETRRSLVSKVLEDEHTADDLQGGTFTVTNVGVFDMDVSYSIINPPEVAILAVGRRKYAPVERDGDVDFEKVVTFSLTIDHRVLDGADSGAFLDQLAEYVEHPGIVLESV